jgi:hypothetical protein
MEAFGDFGLSLFVPLQFMYLRKRIALLASALILSVGVRASFGADILQNVPPDALGFVVVRNAGDTDAKVQRLLASLKSNFASPLALLQSAVGINVGLDGQGDYMIVAIPGQAGADQPDFCVWLPVSNYEALVTSVGSKPGPGITAVTIAGEDLLVAQHGDWALVMDPEQRSRMEQQLAGAPNPPAQVAAWKQWIESNNVTAVALADGVRVLMKWGSQSDANSIRGSSIAQPSDDLFGEAIEAEETPFAATPSRRPRADDLAAIVQQEFRKWLSASPDLQRWAMLTAAIGCGVRLDSDGNAVAGMRLAVDDDLFAGAAQEIKLDDSLPPALYQDGDFIVNGAARSTRLVAAPLASALMRLMAYDLTNEERIKIDEENVAELQKAAERAAANMTAMHFFSRPGGNDDGLYTNNFLVVRAADAAQFVEQAAQVMQAWNKLNLDAEGETRFVFNDEQMKLGERAVRKFSLDLVAADNLPALPEIRQSMEKFFGPGGKMQLWVVPVDDKSALLASATPEQVTAALDLLDRKQPHDWKHQDLSSADSLLPPESAVRIFFSPSGYNRWLRRLMDAMVGTNVIGGPLVKEFPVSPPIGLAADATGRELRADVAIPAKAIEAAGTYWKARPARPRIQLQR